MKLAHGLVLAALATSLSLNAVMLQRLKIYRAENATNKTSLRPHASQPTGAIAVDSDRVRQEQTTTSESDGAAPIESALNRAVREARTASEEARRSRLLSENAARDSRTLRNYVDLVARQVVTEEQQFEFATALHRWVAVDPIGATAWLNEQSPSPVLDSASAQVARFLASAKQFSEAAEWAKGIGDPIERAEAFEEIYAEGYRSRQFSREAVCNSGLRPDRIAAILNGSRLD